MNFFENQSRARRRAALLLALFALALLLVAALLAGVFTLVGLVFFLDAIEKESPGWSRWWVVAPAGAAVVFIVASSVSKLRRLRGSDEAVVQALGGVALDPRGRDPARRRLLNVVEEMAVASGIPTPRIYVLERESGINAFAAGEGPGFAVIAVTRGFLEHLERDEMQGVIAHEFSHIFNGDLRLNLLLAGLLHGILSISLAGDALFEQCDDEERWIPRRGRAVVAAAALGFLLKVVGALGVLIAWLLRAAIGREREWLADATAVQFTRHPLALAGALKKIGGHARSSRIAHPAAREFAHFFFADPGRYWDVFEESCHPPLPARVLRLDPAFDGRFPTIQATDGPPPSGKPVVKPPPLPAPAPTIERLLDTVGAPVRAHLDAATILLAALAEDVRAAARDPDRAAAVMAALLLDRRDGEIRAWQRTALRELWPEALVTLAFELHAAIAETPVATRLPLADLALPALARLPREEYERVRRGLDALIAADEEMDLFEFTLSHMLRRELRRAHEPERRRPAQLYSLAALAPDVSVVLSALAREGGVAEAEAGRAFAAALRGLPPAREPYRFRPAAGSGLADVAVALERLSGISPNLQRHILAAALRCITHDGTIAPRERELFRAFAAVFECPVPPLVEKL